MRDRRFIALKCLFFLCIPVLIQAQYYAWPVDSNLALTGNYGELRPNHFHTGIDFSTNNKVNVPIYAIEDGFVSRIRISSVGYGKSIYITHPGGRVSVYAHLNSFAEPFQSGFLAEMKTQQVYEKDWYLNANQWPVKRGQLIGKSGNTGGSTGPHVHFEIRDEQTEIPLNPMLFYKFNDVLKPHCSSVAFVDLTDTLKPSFIKSFKTPALKSDSDNLQMPDFESPTAMIGFAFSASDQIKRGSNSNQVNQARLLLDDHLIYSHQFSALTFDNGRYVNEFYFKHANEKFQKCYLPEYFPSGIYITNLQRGRISLSDTLWHFWVLILTDEAGNTTNITGRIKTKVNSTYKSWSCPQFFVPAGTVQSYTVPGMRVQIPQNVLYNSTCLQVLGSIEKDKSFKILPEGINLNSPFQISTVIPKRFEKRKDKLLLKNDNTFLLPTLKGDSAVFNSKATGNFTWQLDTLAPALKALVTKGKHSHNANQIKFLIKDQMSGIADFLVFVNDEWTFVYYDAKEDVLILDLNELIPKGTLKIRVQARDKCGNTSILNTQFKH
jgi:hypothetical protein